MKKIYTLLILSCFIVIANAQDKYVDGVPDDLNKSKTIFLRYDSIQGNAASKTDRKVKYYQAKHNKNVPDANKELAEALKKYPFEYTIASRTDIEELKSRGYKYLLDCLAFQNMETGSRNDNSREYYQYKLYFLDLETNIAYVLTDKFNENQLYFPNYYVNKMVMPKVKKKFK